MKQEEKGGALNRIKDAEEFLESAFDNLQNNRFKASLDHSIDGTIAANDAFTIHFIGAVASLDHREAISLHKEAGRKISENKAAEIALLLEERHRKTYRCYPVSLNLADITFKRASRFLSWVKDKLK